MKMQEAHENLKESYCSIVWDLSGDEIVTASSSDTSVKFHDGHSNTRRFLCNHTDGVTTLALSHQENYIAFGSSDCSVTLYKFPLNGRPLKIITGFNMPVRALSFFRSGHMLAAAGDDASIKLIQVSNGSIRMQFDGHTSPVTRLTTDPKHKYLASLDSDGTLIIWDLEFLISVHTLENAAPTSYDNSPTLTALGWSPDGEILAVSGKEFDVVMYDRITAEKLFTLTRAHTLPVGCLSWSPNGKYIATSGLDRRVIIWDVAERKRILCQRFDHAVCCLSWKPLANTLALIDVMGNYTLLEPAVPSNMKSPTEGASSFISNKGHCPLSFDEEEPQPSLTSEDSPVDSELPASKRLCKHALYDKVTTTGPVSVGRKVAFHSGATPTEPGKKSFLCYNMLGSITTMELDGSSLIEFDFRDTGMAHQVPDITDHFGFTMASMNGNGSVFASPGKGENKISVLHYRPFRSWADNSEWSVRLEDEEVRAVALGTCWVAAVTSSNFLRIFTEGGLQMHVISLDGPVVTVSGFGDQFAVVTHSFPSPPSDEQMLHFSVFNASNGAQLFRGRLPLSPGSCLTWFGFSEEGHLSSFDSMGVLRQYVRSWLPLFSASKLKMKEENYWVVGLDSSNLLCILCKSPDKFPHANPKPVLTLLDLSIPLASSDLGAEMLENEFGVCNIHLSQIQRRIQEIEARGKDTTSLISVAFDTKVALDRCILRLIGSCCNENKLVRAVELVKLLSLEKSVRDAILLAAKMKLANLAERFNAILEERLHKETKTGADTSKTFTPLGE